MTDKIVRSVVVGSSTRSVRRFVGWRSREPTQCSQKLLRTFFARVDPLLASSSLQQRTDAYLSEQKGIHDAQVVEMLNDWLEDSSEGSSKKMEAILSHWLFLQRRPTTTEPFRAMLEKFRLEKDGPRAASVLDQWGQLLEGDLNLAPTLDAFHSVLDAYGGEDVPTVLGILDFLERAQTAGTYYLQPKLETYAHVINGISLSKDASNYSNDMIRLRERLQYVHEDSSPTKESVFFMMKGYCMAIEWAARYDRPRVLSWFDQLDRNLTPSIVEKVAGSNGVPSLLGTVYSTTFATLLKGKPLLQTARRAWTMVMRLEELGLEGLPRLDHYQAAINVWAHPRWNPEAEERLQDLLHRVEEKHLIKTQLPLSIYKRILRVWCHGKDTEKAEALLLHVLGLWQDNQLTEVTDELLTIMFNYVLQAHFQEEKPSRTYELWERMQKEGVPPDSVTYGFILKALSRNTSSVPRMNTVWRMLMDDPSVEAVATHYTSVAATYSRSPGKRAASQANKLLEELEQKYQETGREEMKPLVAIYSAVITAWGRSRDPQAARKAQEVFERMKRRYTPDVPAYSSLMDALGRQHNPTDAQRAEDLLNEMETIVRDTQDETVRPTQICYTTVMRAWGTSGAKDAPQRAEAVLKRLEEVYRTTNDESYKPDVFVYSIMLDAWSRATSKEGVDRAEKLLNRMRESNSLNTTLYTNVILCHWRGGSPNAANRADALLEEMKEAFVAGNVQVKPDVIAYTTVIQTWARSKSHQKALRAWELLQEACTAYKEGNLDLKPNVITFTAVLNACAFTRGSKENRNTAVRIALMAMNELQSYDRPSHITFRTLLQVFGNQVPDMSQRAQYSSVAFRQCCQEGQVHDSIIEALRKYVPSMYDKLPRDKETQELSFPPEWTINIEAKNR